MHYPIKNVIYRLLFLIWFTGVAGCGLVDSGGEGDNKPPDVSGESKTVKEQEEVTLESSVVDDFGDITSFKWEQASGPVQSLSGADTAVLSFTAPTVLQQDSPLELSFKLTVIDNFGDAGEGVVNVKVEAVNDKPLAAADSVSVEEGGITDPPINVIANDDDLDGEINPASVIVDTDPVNGAATVNEDGTITYTHDGSETIEDSFTYTVEDQETAVSDPATVSVIINPVNDPPVAVDDIAPPTVEDTAVVIDVLSNDIDEDDTIDPGSITVTTAPASGATAVSTGGTVTYTPSANFFGSDSFGYTVQDNLGAVSNEAKVSITVTPLNDPPDAVDDSTSVDEDNPTVINVIANDTDVEGGLNPVTVLVTSPPANGSATPVGDGQITYTPNPDFTGADSFTYSVQDVEGLSDTATVTINVIPVNDPPTISDITDVATDEDIPLDVGFTVSDGDTPAEALTVSATSSDTSLISSIVPEGSGTSRTIKLTPAADKNGAATITVTVNDGDNSVTDTFVVTVTAVNDAPVSVDDPASTPEETPVAIDVLANDSDVDSELNRASVAIITAPLNGTTTIDIATGAVTYQPNPDFSGSDSFGYNVKDIEGLAGNTATVSITVEATDDPPTISDIPDQSPISANTTLGPIAFTVGDETPDSLSVTATSSDQVLVPDANIVLGGAGTSRTISVTPAVDQSGSATITVNVSDSITSVLDNFGVTVEAVVNAPPVVTSGQSFNILENSPDGTVVGDVAATDPEDSPVTGFVIVSGNENNAFIIADNGNNSARLTVANGGALDFEVPPPLSPPDPPRFELQITATDGTNTSAAEIVTVFLVDDPAGSAENNHEGKNCWTTLQQQVLQGSLANSDFSKLATYELLKDGVKGVVTMTDPSTGQFEYQPNATGSRGVDTFTYRVDDPRNGKFERAAQVIIIPRVMPLGDEITSGMIDGAAGLPRIVDRVGYRKPLYDALHAEQYSVDLVGSQIDGNAVSVFDPDNEGHSGWAASELAYGRLADGTDGVYAWLDANPADVVLIHAGTYGLTSSADQVRMLLDEIDRWEQSAGGNEVAVVLARIIDQNPVHPDVSALNSSIMAMVNDRINNPVNPAYPDNVIIVDQQASLEYPGDLFDDIHPTATGYQKMAGVWKDALVESGLVFACP